MAELLTVTYVVIGLACARLFFLALLKDMGTDMDDYFGMGILGFAALIAGALWPMLVVVSVFINWARWNITKQKRKTND